MKVEQVDEHPWKTCLCEDCRDEYNRWEDLRLKIRLEMVERVNQFAWDLEYNSPKIAFMFQRLADELGMMIDVSSGGNR